MNFLIKLFGQNWKTTLTGIAVLVFTLANCLLSGGGFGECLTNAQTAVTAIIGVGFLAASDSKATK